MKRRGINDLGFSNGVWPMGETGEMESPATDPQGMYTGIPENPWEPPVQDADDL